MNFCEACKALDEDLGHPYRYDSDGDLRVAYTTRRCDRVAVVYADDDLQDQEERCCSLVSHAPTIEDALADDWEIIEDTSLLPRTREGLL